MLKTVPLEPFLYKYAVKQPFYKQRALHFTPEIRLRLYDNMDSWLRYFERKKGCPKIPVEIDKPTVQRLYAIVQFLDSKFREELKDYTFKHLHMGISAVMAIEGFLDLYSIEEDDFKFESAYKIWQRSRHYAQWKKKLEKKHKQGRRQC